MKYYRAKTTLPGEYNIVLDSKYPAVVAEGSGAAPFLALPPAANPGATAIATRHGGCCIGQRGAQTAPPACRGGDLTAVAAS